MTEHVFTNARIVCADTVVRGSLAVTQGVIRAVDETPSRSPGALDLDGDYLIPGLIDLHTDNLELHYVPRPTVHWNPVSAAIAHDGQVAAAGITTVYDSLALVGGRSGTDRRDTLGPMVEGLRRARVRGMLRVDHWLHLRLEVTDEEILKLYEPFHDDPLVRLVSIMDHTPGQRQFRDVEKWRAMRRAYGLTDEEIDELLNGRIEVQRSMAPFHVRELCARARERGLPLASHDDETPEHVAQGVREGVRIAEFPTTIAAAEAARAAGLTILMGAPNLILGGSHSGNVAAAELAERGLLDMFASDYVPVSLLKAAFALAAPPFEWDLPRAIRTVTATPAAAVGLDDRGRIEPGLRADALRIRVIDGLPVVRGVWCAGQLVA